MKDYFVEFLRVLDQHGLVIFIVFFLQFLVVCWVVIFLVVALASLAIIAIFSSQFCICCGLLEEGGGGIFGVFFKNCSFDCRCQMGGLKSVVVLMACLIR